MPSNGLSNGQIVAILLLISILIINIDERIDYYLNIAKDTGYFPPSFEKLSTYQWKLSEWVPDLHESIKNKMDK